jgi:predicted PurR-regulated permease PerM
MLKRGKKEQIVDSGNWTDRWFFNNRLVSVLLTILLLLIVLFMLKKVDWVFEPLSVLITAVSAPILTAAVFYYLLNTLVVWIQKKTKLNRTLIVSLVFVVILLLLVWAVLALIPVIRDTIVNGIQGWPHFYKDWSEKIQSWLADPSFKATRTLINKYSSDINEAVINWGKSYLSTGFIGLGKIAHVATLLGITLVTFPFVLFYMLTEGEKLPKFILSLLPKQSRNSASEMLGEMNTQISGYIRGQILTGVAVSIIFMIGFSIIGLPYGIWIGILAGPLNLIPYLGSFLAMVPAMIIGITHSWQMFGLVIIVYVIESLIESRLVHPLILGDSLNIHPVTILVVLLAAGEMFGLLGVFLGIPAYAVLKVLVTHSYRWWKENSSIFAND